MASDVYISSYDKNGAKTTHLNSAAAITAPMQYAIWDKTTKSALVVEATSTLAESSLRLLSAQRKSAEGLCVITVPV